MWRASAHLFTCMHPTELLCCNNYLVEEISLFLHSIIRAFQFVQSFLLSSFIHWPTPFYYEILI